MGKTQKVFFITKKCKRYNNPGHAHELTFSCYRNQKFLLSERVCKWLIESIEKAREKNKFSLWAYVFMPDHVHLLIQPTIEQYNISNILNQYNIECILFNFPQAQFLEFLHRIPSVILLHNPERKVPSLRIVFRIL